MVKRFFDILVSFVLLILLMPLFAFLCVVIKLSSKGPCFFTQERVGKNQSTFFIYKFRTMIPNQDHSLLSTKNDSRVTKVGRVLRKLKLDELPQLFNVLKGDISFVGPRPEVQKYVAYYPDDYKTIIFSVRPGITDFASLYFYDESTLLEDDKNPEEIYISHLLPKKLELYKYYVLNRTFLLDLKIIFLTFLKWFSLIKINEAYIKAASSKNKRAH